MTEPKVFRTCTTGVWACVWIKHNYYPVLTHCNWILLFIYIYNLIINHTNIYYFLIHFLVISRIPKVTSLLKKNLKIYCTRHRILRIWPTALYFRFSLFFATLQGTQPCCHYKDSQFIFNSTLLKTQNDNPFKNADSTASYHSTDLFYFIFTMCNIRLLYSTVNSTNLTIPSWSGKITGVASRENFNGSKNFLIYYSFMKEQA